MQPSRPLFCTDSPRFRAMCEAVLAAGSRVRFHVRGMSMQPNLLDGDKVVIVPASVRELKKGDIVLLQSEDGLRVHRIVAVEAPDRVVTRGDAGVENDPGTQTILGRVIEVERDNHKIWNAGPGQKYLDANAALARRLKLAASVRLRRLGSSAALLGLILVLGMLVSAAPAAAQADLTMSQATSVTVVDTGINFNYTEIVTNNGPSAVPAGTLVVYQQTPPNTTLQSITVDANWNCSNPGTAGPIICTYVPALASGTNTIADPIVFTLSVNAGTTYGTTILNSATVTSQTTDPVPSNNTSITTVLVEPAAQADLALSMTASPTPVFLTSNLTYTIQVQNLGQANAATVQVTDTIPAGTTFVSATAPAGWTCAGTTTVTCSLASTMAMGASATITIAVTSPTAAGPISNTASVSSSTADPVASNNSATVITVVQPLVCATPGKDGAGGTLSGVVNTYYRASANGTLAAGSKTVTLAAGLPATGQPIAAGDLLLIIQLQDALINNTNSSSYGHGVPGDPATGSTNLQSTGLFEYVTATNAVPIGGGALTFTGTGANGGTLNSYVRAAYSGAGNHGQQRYEVIRVPQYTSATLSSALVPLPWDGNLGGILAIDVASQLTLGGTVSADSLGFRGGGGLLLTGSGGGVSTDYVSQSANNTDGSKGEGIAGTPRYIAPATITTTTTPTNTGAEGYPNGSFARGAPGNAGGGSTDGHPPANDFNSGGGGGGNGGTGGLGGYGWNSFTVLNSTDGGFGGLAFPAATSALVMGGGGGAGSTNNGSYFISATNHDSNSIDPPCSTGGTPTCTGIYSSGGAGGGIVIVHTGSVAGTGTITSNGQSTLSTDNDSTGGGGAGGSILFFANSGTLAGLTVSANGGSAGNAWPEQAPGTFTTGGSGARHGPGGGGGGGVILLSGAPAAMSVSGGANGYTNSVQDSFGATPGQLGVTGTNHIITETPGAQPGAYCASADLAVTNSGTPAVVVAGNNITYTQGVTNNGPQAAVNAVFSEAIPANTTFQSLSVPAGWTCSTPAVGATGNISCTNPSVANAANSSFTLVVKVNAGTANQTQITDTASVTSGTNDPNLANNSASVTTIVGSATSANLAVTNTATPNPVQAGNNISYTQVVTNNGPAAAANVTFTETLPANTTFVSMTTPAGWSCSTPSVGGTGTITCTIASLAAGATATFNPVLQVAAGTASGTVISDTASVSSSTPDPNPTSNSATVNVTVASAGQADMAVSASASPNPVLAGGNITLTQTATNNGPAAAATDTFTETIPATASFVSLGVPAGWSCTTPAVGASGNVNCTATTDASGNVSSFPLVIKALLSDTPGTAISLTPTAGSATSDPISSNNSVTVTVYVASPTQADMAIQKTASPEPVDQNTNLVYTLQVTNNGPAAAQGVTVTDNLPTSSVSYVSSSTTQGSCTTNTISQTTPYPSTLQVACNIGTVGVGNLVIVTINVTANTFSSSTTATNTATVSATTGDPNPTNNSSTAVSTIQAPTDVQLVSFRAISQANGSTLLEWKTREEVRNLGFNIYREDAAGSHRLNPSLIAGSALILRGSQPQHAAKTYRWIDPQPASGAVYWLEDVDLGGSRNSHGPAQLDNSAQPKPADIAAAPLLSQLNQLAGPARPALASGTRVSKLAEFQRPAPVPEGSVQLVNLDGEAAVQISIQQEGWYRVTRAQLAAAGLDPDANAHTLQLFAEGHEQPLLIVGNPHGPLGANDAIEFYGTGIDTPYSGTRVYWLVWGRQSGKRVLLAPRTSGSSQPVAFPAVAVREDRTTYFAALLNGEDQDNFFGDIVTNSPVDEGLTVVHSVVSNLPVTLDVTLQGATDQQDHSVAVVFNGTFLGNINFSNLANFKSTLPVDPALVQDGANTVNLTALDGDNDVSLVQSVVLHYAHSFIADNDQLRMDVASASRVHVSGFSNPRVRVFDVTNPAAVEQLPGVVQSEASGFGIDFAVPGSPASNQTRLLLALADDEIAAPSAVTFHARSSLANWREGASEIIIAHPNFVPNLAPLVHLRQEQGLSVKVITTDEIFNAYNYGERSPYAIRTLLQEGVQHWRIHPQYILLMGDASLDPRNYLGFGDLDFVPTRLIDTAALKTASDDWFTDFNQTGFQTIPTGRLPVDTGAEADLVISKIVGYESGSGAGPWNHQALIVADQNVGVNFSATANGVVTNFGNSLAITKILGDQIDPQTAKQQILGAINSGQALVNYVGHGSVEQWSFSDLLDDSDVAALQNGNKLPVFLLMDCLNGFFQDVYTRSLAESLLLSPNGGAVAVWASSGFTDATPQAGMDLALTQLLASHPNLPLGKAILSVKPGVADRDVRRTWILFGDPAMRIHLVMPEQTPAAPTRPDPPHRTGRFSE